MDRVIKKSFQHFTVGLGLTAGAEVVAECEAWSAGPKAKLHAKVVLRGNRSFFFVHGFSET